MSYKIVIVKKALKELNALPIKINSSIAEVIEELKEEPRPIGCKKLKGERHALWRIRVGDYRILYSIEDSIKIIEVRRVGHRRDIYNK